MNAPLASVSAVLLYLLMGLEILIETPGTTAPVGSTTVPCTVPDAPRDCAAAAILIIRKATTTRVGRVRKTRMKPPNLFKSGEWPIVLGHGRRGTYKKAKSFEPGARLRCH